MLLLVLGGTCYGTPDPSVSLSATPSVFIISPNTDEDAMYNDVTLTVDIDLDSNDADNFPEVGYLTLKYQDQVIYDEMLKSTQRYQSETITFSTSILEDYTFEDIVIDCEMDCYYYAIQGDYRTAQDSITIYIKVEEVEGAPDPQWRDSALSQGRKISLSGMPMPDVAQHQEGESDYAPENTYVDAFSLDLQHSTTDIHVPVGSDHFALEARRSLGQEVWTTNSLPFDERPDLPFGPCWSSPVCPTLKVVENGGTFRTFIATDHNGEAYTLRGGMWWSDVEGKVVPTFWAEPTTAQSALSLRGVDMDLSDWDSTNVVVELTLQNGTIINYDTKAAVVIEAAGLPVGGGMSEKTSYYRAHSVIDRTGNALEYGYTGLGSSLIPNTIEASSGQILTIKPSTDGKRIERITDPSGNYIDYFYTTSGLLETVQRMDGGTTSYTYTETLEKDERGFITPETDVIDYHHLTIEHIIDANLNTNAFVFTKPLRFSYSTDVAATSNRLDQIGNNRILSSITRPDQSLISFSEANEALGTVRVGPFTPYELNTDRMNMITDVNSNEWCYVFSEPHASDPLASGSPSNVRLFEYKKMEIRGPEGATETYRYGLLGEEVYDGLEPLVIIAQTNFSGQSTTYAYDLAGEGCYNPSSVTNALGGVTHSEYFDLFGYQLESTTNELSQFTVYGFDEIGNRTSSTNFSDSGVALSITQMEYTNTTFPNFMTRQTIVDLDNSGASNLVTEFTAHDFGKVKTQTTFPDGYPGTGLTTTYDYDENNNLTYVRDPKGNVTTNGYDQLNRLVEIAFFDAVDLGKEQCTKKFWYDQRSNKTWEKDENNHYTFFQYDEFNRVTNTVRIMAQRSDPSDGLEIYSPDVNVDIVSSSGFNPDGTLTYTVDSRQLRTEFYYDDLRRLTNSIVDPGEFPHLNYSISYAYSTDNNYCGAITLPPYKFTPTSVTDPRGYNTQTVYDALNRPVESWAEVTNGVMSKLATMGYDPVGNLRYSTNWVSSSNNQVTQTLYDGLNRPYQVINPDSTEVGVRYTSTGLQWQTTNELDRVSTVIYDLAGRPVKTISPALADGSRAITETDYDANGNVSWVKDANGNITTTVYDYRNRATETIAPMVYDATVGTYTHPTITSVYDPVGNVVSITDAKENTTTNFYDAANRLYETWAPEVMVYGEGLTRPVTTNGYDKAGNIVLTMDANEKTVRMQYDIVGRLTNTIDAINNTISFVYDENGNQIQLTDGNTNTTTFAYDGLNRKTSTIYPGGTMHEDAVYDLVGNRVKRVDCNGKTTQYDYDVRNRLEVVSYPEGNDFLTPRRTYSYDAVGNLEAVIEEKFYNYPGYEWYVENLPNAAVSYTYDNLNRVDSETSVGVTHHYKYDLNGNRTDATYGLTDRQVEWEYDALNRISEIRDLTSAYASTNTVVSGTDLQVAIDAASAGDLILVADGTYDSVVLSDAVTLKSENGPGAAIIEASGGNRAAHLSNGAQLIGFTLTGGTLGGTNCGAGAFVDTDSLISDCVITNNQTAVCFDVASPGGNGGGLYLRGNALRCTIVDNTAWNGAGVFLEDGASMSDCTISFNTAGGVNSYGGGLYLQDGATAVNCMVANNTATDGGGLFFEKGGFARDIGSISNTVDSIGGAGAFLWAGGTLRNGVIEGNVATNTYARGGAGILFYDEGGLIEDSVIAGNTSVNNGGVHYRYSGMVDPGQLGTLNNSILWNNGSQSTVWAGTGNQTIDPASVTNAATGAQVETYSYANAETRTTAYFYDLNGNAVKRVYPTRVEETRSFDAMNRLLTLKTETVGRDWFEIAYEYDAVGSLRRLEHTRSTSLAGKAPAAVYTWNYDARYRLTNEDLDITGGTNYVTSYTWDDADNRRSKKAYEKGALKSDITYTNNALNQLTGWHDAVADKNVSYVYDDNGSRQSKTVYVGGVASSLTEYEYDVDNRLLKATVDGAENTFEYDYRSRRYYRATATETNICVFDGGLSIQEYDATTSTTPHISRLTTEFIRGEGMGGGVGGMVYSIRKDGDGKDQIICSHANHRGDVIARSDEDGSLTSFALYEAYGTRPYEWDDGVTGDPDRQKANTKEEESDLGLLNEGMRFRDLETGTFLTADPLEFSDGPNRYCYVHCNPITHFDAFGLEESPTTGGDEMDDEDDPLDDSVDAYDAALMAEDSYRDSNHKAPEGYEHVKDYNHNGKGDIGFSASLYRNKNTQELVLAFRGTENGNGRGGADWKANGQNGVGEPNSAQYDMAMKTTQDVIKNFAGGDVNNLTLVGHSLGGGLASSAAVTFGIDAITFNAAGMNPAYAENSSYNANDLIDAYYVKGEVLSAAQDFTPAHNAAGNRHALPSVTCGAKIPTWLFPLAGGGQSVDLHSMKSVKASLDKAGYADAHKQREHDATFKRLGGWDL
jgi:RHS repeat-associated protein